MRFILPLLAVSIAAQEPGRRSATYSYDLNGNRVLDTHSIASNSGSSQWHNSINGQQIPLESVEEKVVSQGAGVKTIERLIRRQEPGGMAGATTKILIQESANPDGTTNRVSSIFEQDLNGSYSLRERQTTTASKTGEAIRAETRVERPDANGAFGMQELHVEVTTGNDKDRQRDLTVLRPDGNGAFTEAVRKIERTRSEEGRSVTTMEDYNTASTGKMELSVQTVSTTSKTGEGEITVMDVYGAPASGRALGGGLSGPQLRERQTIEKRRTSGGTREIFSVSRVELESGRLGPEQRISETHCKGNCK
jgi:hypothetical protein